MSKIESRSGQVKSFETIAVLMVFFFLLVFGAVFYARVQMSGFEREIEEHHQTHTVNVALQIAHLPELDCVQIGIKKENCFDQLKVQNLAKLIEDAENNPALINTKLSYFLLFEYSVISIAQLDEMGVEKSRYTVYNNSNANMSSTQLHMPVKIFDPIAKTYDFGYIEVRVYGG